MDNYIYTKESNNSFFKTVEKIKDIIPQKEFKILAIHDIKSTLNSKNFEMENYVIIELCNAKSAHEILSISKEVGLFLPCKINVYENNNKIIVSALLPDAIKNIFKMTTDLPLALFEEVANTLKSIVDESLV
jgi:uncharacterized protein (DUF302 family)